MRWIRSLNHWSAQAAKQLNGASEKWQSQGAEKGIMQEVEAMGKISLKKLDNTELGQMWCGGIVFRNPRC